MSDQFEVKDSGKREEFGTGAARDTREGKGRYDLISPIALERLAKHMELGAAKYGDHNWERGLPTSRCMDSALRHLNKYLQGHRDEDHLSAAVFNIFAIVHVEHMVREGKLVPECADMPNQPPLTRPTSIEDLRKLADQIARRS